jgi:copper chaperone
MVVPRTDDSRRLTVEQRTYSVSGMTCGHCVNSVQEEVGEIPGVSAVEVVLDTGLVTVTGDGVSDDAVRAAVEEAGYAVTS